MSLARRVPSACLALLALTAAGCGSTAVPGSFILVVRFGDNVPAADRERLVGLDVSSTGDGEPYRTTITHNLDIVRGGNPMRVRYIPGANAGALHFEAEAKDGRGDVIARAAAMGVVDPAGEPEVTLVLERPAVADGGADLGPDLLLADMAGVDLTMPDLAMPDLALPDLAMPDLREVDLLAPDLRIVDLHTPDLAMPDLAMPDLAEPPDLAMPDLAMPDLAMPDLLMPDLLKPDLTIPPDMVWVFQPSHVNAARYRPMAGDMPASLLRIDTSSQRLYEDAGNGNLREIAVPVGGQFTVDGNYAVLSVGKWTMNAYVEVYGDRPLVVVAAGDVTINQQLYGGAYLLPNDERVPGPGGGAAGAGSGGGGAGVNVGDDDGGGGGAGFLTNGGKGGDAPNNANGGAAGAMYGGPINDFRAGSGGGHGADVGRCGAPKGRGGPGGGGIQISSATKITIGANGFIDVNGTYGGGGCSAQGKVTGGAGGGSGGTIFLEAPQILVTGNLWANGGSGGAGGNGENNTDGANGERGKRAAQPAVGGAKVGNGGAGGSGGISAQTGPFVGEGGIRNAGGGGGSAGRIYLRTRMQQATVQGIVSPPNVNDTGL